MALPPDENAAFLREVDDNLRQAQLQGFFTRWGKFVVGAVVVALVILAGVLSWRSHQQAEAGLDSERLGQALNDIEQGQAAKATPALAELADSSRAGYRGAGRMAQAASAAVRNDPKGAVAQYAAIAADTSMPQPIRDLALIRGTTIEFDSLPPATVVARMKPLAVSGNPWFGSAGELTIAAWLKMNRPDQAGPMAAAITRDPQVPLANARTPGGHRHLARPDRDPDRVGSDPQGIMMTKRFVAALALVVALSGCGIFKGHKGPKTAVLGERIPVLTSENDAVVEPSLAAPSR